MTMYKFGHKVDTSNIPLRYADDGEPTPGAVICLFDKPDSYSDFAPAMTYSDSAPGQLYVFDFGMDFDELQENGWAT